MNMFEEARVLRGMLDMCSSTQGEIAEKLGVSQSYVANKLRLLNFSEPIQKIILDSNLTERHARLLLKLKNEALVKTAIEKIAAMNLCVSASEALIDNMLLDEISTFAPNLSSAEQINRIECIIEKSVKNLAANGIKAKHSIYFTEKNKYITICIEE